MYRMCIFLFYYLIRFTHCRHDAEIKCKLYLKLILVRKKINLYEPNIITHGYLYTYYQPSQPDVEFLKLYNILL